MQKNDRFGKEWSGASTSQEYPSDSQAQQGLAFLGATPPSYNLHDAMFQALDWKDNWLYDQIKAVLDANGVTPDLSVDGDRTALAQALTQALLNQQVASTAKKGIVELATDTESRSGSDQARASTPSGVFAAFQQFGLGNQNAVVVEPNDNSLENGFYRYLSSAMGAPTSDNGKLLVVSESSNYRFELASPNSNAGVYYRVCNGGSWGEWQLIANAMTEINAGNGLSGGGDLTSDRTISMGTPSTLNGSSSNSASGNTHTHALDIASQSDAESGTNSTRLMTPQRVFQSMRSFSNNLSASGYQVFPSGLIMQWGSVGLAYNGNTVYSGNGGLPIPFPNSFFSLSVVSTDTNNPDWLASATIVNRNYFKWNYKRILGSSGTTGGAGFTWIAIGN